MMIRFLTMLYKEGKGYSCLNTARSAVTTLNLHETSTVGSNPLVCKFLRGVFNRRPTLPKYTVTWDASRVISFLKNWSPAKFLSLKQLTLKVLLLCLMVSGHRGQTIQLLDTRNITWTKEEARCRIGDLLKTTKPGHHQTELVFGAFPPDRSVCAGDI